MTDLPISVVLLAGALVALLLPMRSLLVAALAAGLALVQAFVGLVPGPEHVHLLGETFALGYAAGFALLGTATWWLGALFGSSMSGSR